MLIMINAKDSAGAVGAISKMVNFKKVSAPGGDRRHRAYYEVMDAIIEAHPVIAKYFNSDSGVMLQRIESNICVDILSRFERKELPLPLPEYDSFITSFDQEAALRNAMVRAYKQIIGDQYSIQVEKKY
jgi:hypothetical protein